MSELQGRELEPPLWPPLLDVQDVWETEELEPPPDWEELTTKWAEPPRPGATGPDPCWEELGAPYRLEPDPEL